MNDFGGKGKPFTNVYPIRYPGTWDTTGNAGAETGPRSGRRPGEAFLKADMVRSYVADPENEWDAAMRTTTAACR